MRKSKTKNYLLAKDGIGMRKAPYHDLPDFSHVYGMVGPRDDEDVKDCKLQVI